VKLVMKIALGIIVAVILLMVGCSALIASDPEVRKATEALDNPAVSESTKPAEPAETAKPGETVAQENARRSAESYIDTAAFSRSGLIGQLKYEGFTQAQATYGVNAVGL
jgi:hypothetical protein